VALKCPTTERKIKAVFTFWVGKGNETNDLRKYFYGKKFKFLGI
jgi:hypothetical protein